MKRKTQRLKRKKPAGEAQLSVRERLTHRGFVDSSLGTVGHQPPGGNKRQTVQLTTTKLTDTIHLAGKRWVRRPTMRRGMVPRESEVPEASSAQWASGLEPTKSICFSTFILPPRSYCDMLGIKVGVL